MNKALSLLFILSIFILLTDIVSDRFKKSKMVNAFRYNNDIIKNY
tara:strand:- start:319 stop:453 length:135 start_codon:yes stop_codon:yes gene_type:complete